MCCVRFEFASTVLVCVSFVRRAVCPCVCPARLTSGENGMVVFEMGEKVDAHMMRALGISCKIGLSTMESE